MTVQRGGWHPEDIKAAIKKRGSTLSALAESAGLHKGTVRIALYRPLPVADTAIAAFLELPKHALWPDRYAKDGQPIYLRNKSRNRLENTRRRRPSHRETKVAA